METSKVFNVVVDEDRSHLLQLMIGMTMRAWDKFEVDMPEEAKKLQPIMLELVKELSEKLHAQGWCKDPYCEDK